MKNKHPLEVYSAYLDGHCLSDAEVEALRSWIAADEKNAVEFIEFAILHAAITDRLRLGQLLDDLGSHRSPAWITPSLLANAIREIESNSPRIDDQLLAPEAVPEQPSRWIVYASTAAMAAAVLIGILTLLRKVEVSPIGPAAPPAVAIVPKSQPPKVAARLATSFDAKWGEPQGLVFGQSLVEGDRLTLLSGAAQLNMLGGAVVVIEGPTDLVLSGSDALRMQHGKAAVRISSGGGSFVVDTPRMQVIDMGTEFGVEANAFGDEQVMVFDGSVALAESTVASSSQSNEAPAPARRLDAGFQMRISADDLAGVQAAQAEVLTNPRYFLRPDEVEVRRRSLGGSSADRKLASHFERQRIEGLLAYQGFDAATRGVEFALGTNNQGLQVVGSLKFIEDVDGKGLGIEVQNGPVYFGFDLSAAGPFARAGLLNDAGRIGRDGTEIWLTWRSQRMHVSREELGSAGVSLMFGNRDDLDEPVFFGRGFGVKESLAVESAWGGVPAPNGQRVAAEVAPTPPPAAAGEVAAVEQPSTWTARVEFRDGADRVSVWLDTDLAMVDTAPPHAVLDVSHFDFDRIRMAVNQTNGVWRFSEFAAALNPHALVELNHVAKYQMDQQ